MPKYILFSLQLCASWEPQSRLLSPGDDNDFFDARRAEHGIKTQSSGS